MNGFAQHDIHEDAFGDKSSSGAGGLKTFDAFPKTKPSYTAPSRRGGQWTLAILIVCTLFTLTELKIWFKGTESHHFSVEKGVSHELQLNLDMVVSMPCELLRVNIQDAAGDHILAGELLKKEDTSWKLWMDKRNQRSREYQTLSQEDEGRVAEQEADAHVRHVLGEVRHNPRKKFPKGPRMRWGEQADSCRVFGSLEGNKVQGDFHITARGHGYREFTPHLDHNAFNFSHMITELSFGPHYPTLHNPLDKTIALADSHYYKSQYFLSVVPTIYSKGRQALETHLSLLPRQSNKNMIFTNQYAATSQAGSIPENPHFVPGIFFKYNIEPILLLINEQRGSFLALLIRLVNTVSGVLVAGGWMYQMVGWWSELRNRRRGRSKSEGVLTGKEAEE